MRLAYGLRSLRAPEVGARSPPPLLSSVPLRPTAARPGCTWARDFRATRDASVSLRWARPAPPAYGLHCSLPGFLVAKRAAARPVIAFWSSLLICLFPPPVAVLRSPHAALRASFAPFGGWSLSYAPARALRFVSHSCLPPLLFVAGAVIPRPFGQSGFVGASPLPFFVGYRFVLALRWQGCFPLVQLPSVCQPCPRLDCPLAVVLFYRLPPCATLPLFASWRFAPRC